MFQLVYVSRVYCNSYVLVSISYIIIHVFQFLFHQPLHVMTWLLGLAGILVVYQFFRLLQSIQWSHVLCLALMLFCNFYTVFKLLRDFFIMSKTYRDHDPAANTQ